MGTITIPRHLILYEKTVIPNLSCHECGNKIVKGPFIRMGEDGPPYCNKCSRARMETHIASLKFHMGEISSMLETYFPKTKKNKSDDINVVSTL